VAKKHIEPKFMKATTVQKVYDIGARTLSDMCLKDLRMKMEGRPEEGPFHGRAVKLGNLWHIPVAELRRLFREGM